MGPTTSSLSAAAVSESELRAALLRVPGVADCAVLATTVGGNTMRVGYIVPSGPLSITKIEAQLRESGWTGEGADVYVPVTAIPLTDDGEVDQAALSALPVLDASVAAELEAALLAHPRVEHAAVFVDEIAARRPALSVAEIVPAAPRAGAAEPERRASDAVTDEPPPQADLAAEHAATLPPALVHGDPLQFEADAPQTLPAVLVRNKDVYPGNRITYLGSDGSETQSSLEELEREARRIAGALQARGLTKGQSVILQLTDSRDILEAFWGCLMGGFVPAITPVPTSYASETNDLERLCHVHRMLAAPPIITTPSLRGTMQPLQERLSIGAESILVLDELRARESSFQAPELDPDATAFLVFTSGSTGMPKIIMLSHRNILTRSAGTNILCRHDEHDRILNWLPFDHIGSISDWHLRCVHVGCHMVYCAKEYVLGDPLNWLRLIDRYRITHSWAPNFAYALVNDALGKSQETWDLSCMKALLTAGEAVSSSTVHEFLRKLAPHGLPHTALRPAFGMAELGSGVTYYQPTPEQPLRVQYVDRGRLDGALLPVEPDSPRALGFTSLGPVIPGAAMRIVDEAGQVVPELTVGKLQIAGGPVCLGYYQNPEANREVFVGDGWFNTGDRGFIAGRELYLTGRDKESLIINGANYHNSEIEHAVEQVDGLEVSFTAACAVRPPGDFEERLAVFFCPSPSGASNLADLLRRVQNSVARKTGVKPDFLLPVETTTIPKTAIGKIQRKQLVKRFESGEFDALVRRVEVLLEDERKTVPDWFLAPVWRKKALGGRAANATGRSCLVLSDGHALAGELVRELAARGVTAVEVNPSQLGSAVGQAPTDVCDLTAYAPIGADLGADPRALVERAAEDLVALVKRLELASGKSSPRGSSVRALVVAAHAQAVRDEDRVDLSRAMTPALLKSLVQERPTLHARHLDLPFTSDTNQLKALAEQLAGELTADPDDEDEVAYRDGARWVRRFQPLDWSTGAGENGLRPGGLYLVTGGLGGVGAELARTLLRDWGVRLLIVGRTALEPSTDDAKVQRALATLNELQGLGDVRYRALDVGDPGALEAAVSDVERELGQGLDGVFHLAGAYHELLLSQEKAASLLEVLRPKAAGALAVHRLLQARPNAFAAYFSSLAGIFAGSGIGAYAAANRFLDALAREQRARGLRARSFDWAVWKGLGIGADSAPAQVLRSKGYYQIPTGQGLASLGALLARPVGQALIGIDPSNPNVARWVEERPRPLLGLRAAYSLKRGAAETPETPIPRGARDRLGREVESDWRELSSVPLTNDGQLDRAAVLNELRGAGAEQVPPRTPLERQLVQIWKDVLGVESLGTNQSFFDLGGTSLLSVRLLAEVERQLGVSLTPAALFQAATVQALARLIEATGVSGGEGPLILLADGDAQRTLFLLHDIDGNTELYRELAQKLAGSVRVYGVPPHGNDRFPVFYTRLPQMVDHYVQQIREVQPQGPYLVGGAGAGAVLAFEVACRLQTEGHRVALVALIDADGPEALNPWIARGRVLKSRLKQGGFAARLIDPAALASTLRRELAFLGRHGVDQARVRLFRMYADREVEPPWFLELIPPRSVLEVAGTEYRPSRFDGRLQLFRATNGHGAPGNGGTQPAWSLHATRGTSVIEIPGEPGKLFDDPSVGALADRLASLIAEATAGADAS